MGQQLSCRWHVRWDVHTASHWTICRTLTDTCLSLRPRDAQRIAGGGGTVLYPPHLMVSSEAFSQCNFQFESGL